MQHLSGGQCVEATLTASRQQKKVQTAVQADKSCGPGSTTGKGGSQLEKGRGLDSAILSVQEKASDLGEKASVRAARLSLETCLPLESLPGKGSVTWLLVLFVHPAYAVEGQTVTH